MTRQEHHLNRLREAQAEATRTSLEMARRTLQARSQHGSVWDNVRAEVRILPIKESPKNPAFASSEFSDI